MQQLNKEWFELDDCRRQSFAGASWIPVYGIHITQEGEYPDIGHIDQALLVGSAVIFHDKRKDVEEISDWNFWSPDYTEPWLSDDGHYYEAEDFLGGGLDKLGFHLVLSRYHNNAREVFLHQDFILAYGLIKEGDAWLRPSVDHEEVARQKKDKNENILIEIRAEYLRDYLAARNASLRLYYYRSRMAVLKENPEFNWPADEYLISETHNRCQVYCDEIDSSGDYTKFLTDSEGKGCCFRVEGRMWRGEWIEPIDEPDRFLRIEPPEPSFVYIDASGKKVDLEKIALYKCLFFEPEVMNVLLAKRGANMEWNTKYTGEISHPSGTMTPFGINDIGLVNVIVTDIKKLPPREGNIWVRHTCRPDGAVSKEFWDTQFECELIKTQSPESLLFHALESLDYAFRDKFAVALLQEHDAMESLARRIHRFRAVNEYELPALAKDVVRISIERLEKKNLLIALNKQQSEFQSLKLLQELLEKYTDKEHAYKRMGPLFGVYDLRKADAHLPGSNIDIEKCYELLSVNRDNRHVIQATELLQSVADTFMDISKELGGVADGRN